MHADVSGIVKYEFILQLFYGNWLVVFYCSEFMCIPFCTKELKDQFPDELFVDVYDTTAYQFRIYKQLAYERKCQKKSSHFITPKVRHI